MSEPTARAVVTQDGRPLFTALLPGPAPRDLCAVRLLRERFPEGEGFAVKVQRVVVEEVAG